MANQLISEKDLKATIKKFLSRLEIEIGHIWVGFSGGSDSLALLHTLAVLMKNELPAPIRAIHVNHQISDQSDSWEKQCFRTCQHWQIPLVSTKVRVSSANNNIEFAARNVRYEAFSKHMANNDLLLLGHHLNDQLETSLQRMFNGQGLKGLIGMPAFRRHAHFFIARPLLTTPKTLINEHLKKYNLQPVFDPSNADVTLHRSWVREQLLPSLLERNPNFLSQFNRMHTKLSETQMLCDEFAADDLNYCQADNHNHKILIANFQTLSTQRKKNMLKFWLRSFQLTPPDNKHLQSFISQIEHHRPGKHAECRWLDYTLKSYQNKLFLIANTEKQALINSPQRIQWQGNIAFLSHQKHLIKSESNKNIGLHPDLKISWQNLPLSRKFKLMHRMEAGSKPLKTWLHSINIPPWQRSFYPVIFYNNTPVYLPGLGVIAGTETSLVQYSGMNIIWQTL